MRADTYAGRGRESNPHSLHKAGQVWGELTCFAIPNQHIKSMMLLTPSCLAAPR